MDGERQRPLQKPAPVENEFFSPSPPVWQRPAFASGGGGGPQGSPKRPTAAQRQFTHRAKTGSGPGRRSDRRPGSAPELETVEGLGPAAHNLCKQRLMISDHARGAPGTPSRTAYPTAAGTKITISGPAVTKVRSCDDTGHEVTNFRHSVTAQHSNAQQSFIDTFLFSYFLFI